MSSGKANEFQPVQNGIFTYYTSESVKTSSDFRVCISLNHPFRIQLQSWLISSYIVSAIAANDLGPLLLTWFNFNPSMDK